ncbi:N-acetyl-gamma-glutamyl-phosphate reductase [Nannocystis bainbridge]|uniref:N-acetyl-gamma-glutamyl-phosphate reductase n=1 Tax=Nannocystis bainbridge TaxID=2995303 RepID=A0ABT5EDT6_9BACT|nr:N-acetyl-gamma-glutamyl-phosphate reductase [Nannocystis bainbridge]MDC0723093.1 N-acetyl-gamma-glutamyl-phosphate reductase [Nannocystis bainbridge]
MSFTLGLVGARGHVGGELARLLAGHDDLRLTRAASRQGVGDPLRAHLTDAPADIVLEDMSPETVASWPVDAVVLALPNGLAAAYADALDARGPVLVDLSADYRFDPAWAYGLPERHRAQIRGARRIANPGCYATGIQLGVAPLLELLAGPPQAFGVSGYSGAGTTPSPRNDPERLRDNLMPYALTGHLHEREASHHLGHAVRFVPHVAPFFRGITLTITLPLARSLERAELLERYRSVYADEPLVRVTSDIPEVRDVAGRHDVTIGGLHVDDRHAVVVVTLDNLLKGAASQALQNLNLALGLPERQGVPRDPEPAGP